MFSSSWFGFADSGRFPVVLLVPCVVLLVLGGLLWFSLVPGMVLLALGGFQWFSSEGLFKLCHEGPG